jgi:hypothetical protein
MIRHAEDLSPDQQAAVEVLLGRRIRQGEAVSVRAFEPAVVPQQQKQEIADSLRKYFAEVNASRRPASEQEAEEILIEAMKSVRPGYRPRQ